VWPLGWAWRSCCHCQARAVVQEQLLAWGAWAEVPLWETVERKTLAAVEASASAQAW